MSEMRDSHGGHLLVSVLARHGVPFIFTLVGGHISPVLVAAKQRGIRVVDVRHEATAVFAADAVSRMSHSVGVAAVTAGPGVTNALTALKNAQQAQSPLLLIGGATATVLKGRGSLQDIDQMAVVAPHVKWSVRVTRLSRLVPTVERALVIARSGVPGPVFIECPLDLLYPEATVRDWTMKGLGSDHGSLGQKLVRWYVQRHLDRQFAPPRPEPGAPVTPLAPPDVSAGNLRRVAGLIARSQRPVLVLGSQVVTEAERAQAVARAVEQLGLPVFLAGMSRGLLGRDHPLQLRSQRKGALKEADLVLVAGLPFDFRLNYGMHIPRRATLVAVNHNLAELYRNRAPDMALYSRPGRFLEALAERVWHLPREHHSWLQTLKERDRSRSAVCLENCPNVDPLLLCREVDRILPEDSVLVADGGDFVATASYFLQARTPLSWLDPGVFGTLGVGAGFALGAKLLRPQAEVWLILGDGSLGYSLAEFDSFSRHGLGLIALVGNDGSWAQIARDQVAMFDDDVACSLERSDYHKAVMGLGKSGVEPVGLLLEHAEQIPEVLAQARRLAASGRAVLINAHISTTDFRSGSISI